MRALEIGPGKHPVDRGWDTMDISVPATYNHDISKLPWPAASETYDLVYMSHVLEHVPWYQTIDALAEVRRILKTTGTVEIWVPDFDKLIQGYKNFSTVKDTWRRYNPCNDPMLWLNGRLFAYGSPENWHKCVFTRESLKQCLHVAGFKHTTDLDKPRGYDHGWINMGVAAVK